MSTHERPAIKDYKEDTDVARVHSPVLREKLNISTRHDSPPPWVFVVCALILIGGGTYLGAYSGGFKNDVSDPFDAVHYADTREIDGPIEAGESTLGKDTYQVCSACHQMNGKGIPGQFPPLADSEWVTGGTKRLSLIILKGLSGPIEVAGQTYNGAMPGQNLTDDQLAAVMTHIRTNFGNDAPPVTKEMAANARKEFADITGPANIGILEEIPADEDLTE